VSTERATTEHDLGYELALAAPIPRVFAALTEPAALACWFCHAADVEPGLGGRIVMRWNRPGAIPFEGRWVAFDPPRTCAYEGGNAGYPDGHAGRVEFEFETAPGGGTRLAITHRLPARPDVEPHARRYRGAWPRALARLGELLEG
jgi:uncharacterized protein YndB with AHSA1/START domain